ncbi:cystathionine gamma-synthase [Austwickia chelonae]|uniref:cystathionine gamma-synthase n=1 Tax=Austwickia chelonae TaxID=100225 RepID=UPI0002E00BC1|nr:cystathionine gamma-synthase [Austwickia chelonae]SEW37146.1 cystathionine gamma-synthase [Austwickia chelonae]
MTDRHPHTRAVRAGLESDTTHGAVVPPVYLSSNYTFAGFGEPRRYDYTRSGNPTRGVLGGALADLEGGADGVVTATGMGAVTVVVTALLAPGQRVLAPHDCYGGTWRLFDSLAGKGHFTVTYVDYTDPEAVARELSADAPGGAPSVVWIETPSNPLLRITDIVDIADRAHVLGATVVADNTFCSPLWQQPLALGADIVVHSTTKYLNGHSDVVGGAIVAATAELAEQMAWWANVLGVTGSPFDSYLTLRGLRTLHTRMRAHEEGAAAVVDVLTSHPAVRRVHYPGIPSHPGHEIAARQQRSFGAMISFELADEAAVRRFLDGLTCLSLAESLGGVESLVAHPATMTHASMTAEAQATAGISGGLLRLSIGVEAPEDLTADIRAGLDRAVAQ